MNTLTIRTNNVPRQLIYGYQLTEAEREEFDYLDDDALDSQDFFRFKGKVYDLSQFLRCEGSELTEWEGYSPDSYFSGLVVKYAEDDSVIVGQYFS